MSAFFILGGLALVMLLKPKQGLRASLLSSIGGRHRLYKTSACDELFADPNVDCTGKDISGVPKAGGDTYNLYGYSPPLDTVLAPAMTG